MEKTKGQLNGEQRIDSMLDPNGSFTQYGLTKREHFAGLIMQGLVENNFTPTGFQNGNENNLAELAVKCSDALLEALSKP